MKLETIRNKELFIFDVDGTLYSQFRLRVYMACCLIRHYSFHPCSLRELLAIYHFRKIREQEEYRSSTMELQIVLAANKAGIDESKTREVIERWMFDLPQEGIRRYAYQNVLFFIRNMQKEEKRLVIYSDYPVEKKLQTLDLTPFRSFTADDMAIGELKPSRKAMRMIVQELNCPLEKMIYIGDREEKDKRSAEYAGIDYCDIRRLRKILNETE